MNSDKPASLASKFGVQLSNKPRSSKSSKTNTRVPSANNTSLGSPSQLQASNSRPSTPGQHSSDEAPTPALEESAIDTQSEDNNTSSNNISDDQLENDYDTTSQVVSSVPSSQI